MLRREAAISATCGSVDITTPLIGFDTGRNYMGVNSQHQQIKRDGYEEIIAVEFPEGVSGREVCRKNGAGRREYRKRVELMHQRQLGLCAICGRPLRLDQATFDHERPRGLGGGFRDDRIEIDGEPINAAVHGLCNVQRGSKRTPYLIQPHVTFDRQFEELISQE